MSFLLCLLFCSCFPVTSNSLKKINVNDSEEEVIKVLGQPFSKKAYYNKKYMVYYIHDDLFDLFINPKKFPFLGFYPFLRTGEEYWVILEDNRVVSFASVRNYARNIPKALSNKGTISEVFID